MCSGESESDNQILSPLPVETSSIFTSDFYMGPMSAETHPCCRM
jgi:hypothetical protein